MSNVLILEPLTGTFFPTSEARLDEMFSQINRFETLADVLIFLQPNWVDYLKNSSDEETKNVIKYWGNYIPFAAEKVRYVDRNGPYYYKLYYQRRVKE